MPLVRIRLTKKQMEILGPLFDKTELPVEVFTGDLVHPVEAVTGVIILQPWRDGKTGYAEGKYIPGRFANQIHSLITEAAIAEEAQ